MTDNFLTFIKDHKDAIAEAAAEVFFANNRYADDDEIAAGEITHALRVTQIMTNKGGDFEKFVRRLGWFGGAFYHFENASFEAADTGTEIDVDELVADIGNELGQSLAEEHDFR